MKKKIKTKYVQISEVNDWGYISYKYKNNTIIFPKKIAVRWPNGLETTEKVVSSLYIENINDMGRTDTVYSEKYFIEKNNNGVKAQIPIHRVTISLDQLRFKKSY